MFTKICLVGIISLITLSIFANQISYADDIDKIQPSWTEDLADWWLEETISNIEFVQVLTYLTNNEIIKILESENKETSMNDSIENSDFGDFSIFYMSIEDYGIEPYPGRISTPEPFSKEMKAEKIEVWLRHNQYFEKQVTYLNENIKLPYDIVIGLGECQEEKSFYNQNTKMIVICYELIFDVYDRITTEYKSKGASEKQISNITLDVVDFIFYHQISHVLLQVIENNENKTSSNNNESFIDALSNHIKLKIQKDRENYSITNISLWFKMMHETENLKRPHMWNTHSLSLERLSNIACQDSAFSSIVTLDYVQKGILSKQSIIECKSELLEQKIKLEKISNRILK
ncbi:MAG: hypothetical protein CMH72_03175 [Nitrosopumilus sp.]|nr:hypothetical protein [Nitrosopumilus sp.]